MRDGTFTEIARGLSVRRALAALVLLGASLLPLAAQELRLEDITAGGDGSGNAPAAHTGVDPRNGQFTTGYLSGRIFDAGLNPAPVPGSTFIDSVFIIAAAGACEEPCLPFYQQVTQSGIRAELGRDNGTGSGWNFILKNRNGGVSDAGIRVGGAGFETAVGIHASMGITYDLEALRARHGDAAIGCFSTFWGMDDCAIGEVELFAILSNDTDGVLAAERRIFKAGEGAPLRLSLPREARYLTLVSGAKGNDNCDHGTFAQPYISGACPPPARVWVWRAEPSRVSPQGETIGIAGEGFVAGHRFRAGGVDLSNQVHQGASRRVGFVPPLPLGFHDIEVLNSDGVVARLEGGLEVAPPPIITSIVPSQVLYDRPTPAYIFGQNLRADMEVLIAGVGFDGVSERLLAPRFISDQLITGNLPPLDAKWNDLGGKEVQIIDQGRFRRFSDLVTYVDQGIERVEPSTVSTEGGTPVTFFGLGFSPSVSFRLGSRPVTNLQRISSTEVRGLSPPLPKGPHAAELLNADDSVIYTLEGAVTAAGRTGPAITRVVPETITTAGGEEMVFEGAGFHAGLTPHLGSQPLSGHILLGPGRIRGFAPSLGLGFHNAELLDDLGNLVAALEHAVEVRAAAPPEPPGPAEVESAYAEGLAHFRWVNPVPYERVFVRDLSGSLLRELPGTATSIALPSTRDGLGLQIQGRLTADLLSRRVHAFAFPADCDLPAPLGGHGFAGKLDFPLYGGNRPLRAGACGPVGPAAPGQGGGGGLALTRPWDGINGFLQSAGGVGYTVKAIDRFRPEAIGVGLGFHRFANRLVTGFTLDTDADRLQIDGFYQKLAEASGLSLRGRLVHVYPDDGFTDEFTFPDVFPGEPKGWNGLTYFRSDCDTGLPGAMPNGLKIPAGDYLLYLYAVNGDPDLTHYVFADDGRDVELLIPGAPCPPYPLVRVRDLTGKTTLPSVTEIKARLAGPDRVEFRAVGSWFDGRSGKSSFHSIDESHASYAPHNFEFKWEIESSVPAGPQSSGNSNVFVSRVKTIGCYRVALTVTDKACGRSTRRVLQALAEPPSFTCPAPYFSVIQPVPDPAGIVAVAGLDPPPGAGRMEKPRPLDVRVLVVPSGFCSNDPRALPAEARDIEARLVWSTFNSAIKVEAMSDQVTPGAIRIVDLCASVRSTKLRYMQIEIPDLGKAKPFLPLVLPGGVLDPGAANGRLVRVTLQARTKTFRFLDQLGRVVTQNVTDQWRDVGSSFLMTNRPESLTETYWSGFFSERDQTYRFLTRSSIDHLDRFRIGDSASGIPVGLVPNTFLPTFPNEFTTGMSSAIELSNGLWKEGKAIVDSSGELLGNKLTGSPAQIDGIKRELRERTTYEWCKEKEIYHHAFEQPLFEGIIFTGVIGPIPVTVWATVGLAIEFGLSAQAGAVISPFSKLEGGSFFKSDLFLLSDVSLDIPASIRADILLGVVGVVYKLKPKVSGDFKAHLGARDQQLSRGLEFKVNLSLDSQVKVCLLSFLNDLVGEVNCLPTPDIPIIPKTDLISKQIGQPFEFAPCPGGGGGGGEALGPAAAQGGGGTDVILTLESYYPATKASPDGQVAVEVLYQQRDIPPRVHTLVAMRIGKQGQGVLGDGGLRDTSDIEPAIGWISNRRALILWTRPDPRAAGLDARPVEQYSLAELNLLQAQTEIAATTVNYEEDSGFWRYTAAGYFVSDHRDEVPNPADRRVDGRAAIAGDITREEALAAWVRIDDPAYLKAEPGTTTVYLPRNVAGRTIYEEAQVNTVRPHLDKASIYVRRIGFNGPLAPARRISGGGINVQPAVAYSPSGRQAYCVWVNDPEHLDLITSNRGRNLVYALYDRVADQWSPPRPVIQSPEEYPGLLEPSIALKDDGLGLLAFTALEPDASERDTGIIGANRAVFISRLIGGVFGPPVRVHGKCQKRIYGSQVRIEIPPRGLSPIDLVLKRPEWYMYWQQAGTPGLPESSGGLMVSVLDQLEAEPAAAVALQPAGTVRSNVVATATASGIRTLSLNSGLSRVSLAALGGGGGLPEGGFYESSEIPIGHDLAIASCTLSSQFPGPGALVTARVVIENVGLEGSPATRDGRSAVGLRAVYVEAGGTERAVANVPVPVVAAGGSKTIELVLEQPLEPVRLRVELHPNPLDVNPENDWHQCAFGTPEPIDFACRTVVLEDDEESLAIELTWRNPLPYEEIILYRDGERIASIPGACTTYVDRLAERGRRTYEIRGRIEVSNSCRVATSCELAPPDRDPPFRRGDQDSSGRVDISDAISILNFLFLGSRAPACLDAADADDSGKLDITDPIRILNFLFLGGSAPPAPGPRDCGPDPTPDELGCAIGC
jgi:hypothetical protein